MTAGAARQERLLDARGLTRTFEGRRSIFGRSKRRIVRAVDGVDLHLSRGETLGLVGESGSGKSTTGRLVLGLLAPTAGDVLFEGTDLTGLAGSMWRRSRRDLQMIFQDPAGALDARMTVGGQIREVLDVHRIGDAKDRPQLVRAMLERVGFDGAARIEGRYPHELSGGQRQRVVIARALALGPKLIVCDEPVSALDVSIQAQVINLLRDLQDELGLAYLFISHDLRIVRHISHRIAVMYLGRIVETASRDSLFEAPLHPYTQALLAAVPSAAPTHVKAGSDDGTALEGELPDPADPPTGCRFNTRCQYAFDPCLRIDPALREVKPAHHVACHLTHSAAGSPAIAAS